MKILIYSDLHLHLWKRFGIDERTHLPRRLVDQIKILNQIGKVIEEENIDLVINGGDVWNSVGTIPVEVLNIGLESFESWKVPQLFVSGNHDLVERENPEWFHSAVNILKFYRAEDYDVKIKLVNYPDVVDNIEGYDIVVLHKTPVGSRVGNFVFTDGINWKDLGKKNRLVFFGHIHQRQQLADNVYVIGSPMHLDFSDTGDRGVYIIDTSDWSVKFRKLDYPEFITVESIEEIKEDGNYYRVVSDNGKLEKERNNLVVIRKPKEYVERIKGQTHLEVIREWLKMHDKSDDYLEVLRDILEELAEKERMLLKLRLREVSINNFLSVGDIRYTLPNGFIFIEGRNRVGSNGAGKTTVFGDAILWGLFGLTTKGLKGSDVIRDGEKSCSVKLIFDSEKGLLEIFRKRTKSSGKLDIKLDGVELWKGVRDSDKQKNLEDLLGFNHQFFRAACYFSQEDLSLLTTIGEADRGRIIADLLGFGIYDELYDRVSSLLSGYNKELVEKELEKERKQIELESKSGELKRITEEISWRAEEIEKLKKEIQEEKERKKKEKESELETLTVKLKEVRVDGGIEELKKNLEMKEAEKKEIEEVYESVKRSIVEKKSRKNMLLERLEKLNGLEGKCPLCEQEVLPEYKGSIAERYQKQIEEIDREIEKFIQKEAELKSEVERISNEILNLRDRLAKAEVYQREREEIEERIQKIKKEIEDIESMGSEDINHREWVLDTVLENRETCLNEISNLESQLLDVEDKIKQLNDFIEKLTFWKDAFGSRGIRPLLLDRFCNEFNVIISEIIAEISDGNMRLELSPTTVLKSGEERNRLDFRISIDEVDRTYASLSGGEKRRVDIAVCLALNIWAGRRYGYDNGFLGLIILDELFSFIDKIGEELIASYLRKLGLDRTILVISHTPELGSYCDKVWVVEKIDGRSVLKDESR